MSSSPHDFLVQLSTLPASLAWSLRKCKVERAHNERKVDAASIAALLLLVGTGPAAALPELGSHGWTESVLEPAIRTPSEGFGGWVALHGDLAAVGSPSAAEAAPEAGAVTILEQVGTQWQVLQRILPPAAAASDGFGTGLALDGETLIVGAPRRDDLASNGGLAYVYRKSGSTWSLEATLGPNTPAACDAFGTAIDLEGDLVVVGAPSCTGPGFAEVFRRTGPGVWSRQARLQAGTPVVGDLFGIAVSLSTNRVAVGAVEFGAFGSGAAYIFAEQTAWAQVAELRPTGAPNGSAFGHGLAIDGNTVAIGSPWEGSGKVRLWELSSGTWSLGQTLVARDGNDQGFGLTVDLEADLLAVGVPLGDGMATDSGVVRVWERVGTSWNPAGILQAADGTASGHMGPVSVGSAGRVLAGAPGHAQGRGTAHFFEHEGDISLPGPVCLPETLVVAPFGIAAMSASEGVWPLSWSAPSGDPSVGTGQNFATRFAAPGIYEVKVTDGEGRTAVCNVQVLDLGTWRPPSRYAPDGPRLPPGRPPANGEPDALFFATSIPCGTWKVQLDGSASRDRDGIVVDWRWDLPDGSVSVGPIVEHDFGGPGAHTVRLTVRDDGGLAGSVAKRLLLLQCPPLVVQGARVVVAPGQSAKVCAIAAGGKGGPYEFRLVAETPQESMFDPKTGCLAVMSLSSAWECIVVEATDGATTATVCLQLALGQGVIEVPVRTPATDKPGQTGPPPDLPTSPTPDPHKAPRENPADEGHWLLWLLLGIIILGAPFVRRQRNH